MRKTTLALLVGTLTLTSCGWIGDRFGRNRTAQGQESLVPEKKERNGLFRRDEAPYAGTPITEIVDLQIDPVPGGAIIRTTGRASVVAAHDARLVEMNDGDPRVLALRFLAVQPVNSAPGRTAQGREVTQAQFRTAQQLRGIQEVRIIGARNVLATRR